MARVRSGKQPPRWNATRAQGAEYSRERALKNRAHELERENEHMRAELQRVTESLVRANETVDKLRRVAGVADDANTLVVTLDPAVIAVVRKLAGTGLYPSVPALAAEEIIRLHVRDLVASGKVALW